MNAFVLGPQGMALLEQFEQCRLEAYLDSKSVPTIGWGHTGPDVHMGMTCTQDEADAWLAADVGWAARAVNTLVTTELSHQQFDALVCFTFNCGAEAFRKSTLRAFLNHSQFDEAALEFLKWDKSGGVELKGLLRRREAEMELFQS